MVSKETRGWDNYWKRGELHSCISAHDKENQTKINDFWLKVYSGFSDDMKFLIQQSRVLNRPPQKKAMRTNGFSRLISQAISLLSLMLITAIYVKKFGTPSATAPMAENTTTQTPSKKL